MPVPTTEETLPSLPQAPLAGGCGPGATDSDGQQHHQPYTLQSLVDMQHMGHTAALRLNLKRFSFPKPLFGHPQSPVGFHLPGQPSRARETSLPTCRAPQR